MKYIALMTVHFLKFRGVNKNVIRMSKPSRALNVTSKLVSNQWSESVDSMNQ